MKRGVYFAAIALCFAQTSRDAYRAAYQEWRETDPNLERDAAAGGAAIAQRADRMAGEAAKYGTARKAYLDRVAPEEAQQIAWLEVARTEPSTASLKSEASIVSAETASVTRMIDAFASDPDRGIQQLRQALERERAALNGLGQAIAQRAKVTDTLTAASSKIEGSRAQALEQSKGMLQGIQDASAAAGVEAAAWAEYYRKLTEGSQGAAVPITEAAPGAQTVTLNNPIPAPVTVTPVPLIRYTGSWEYPQQNGLFHGVQPVTIDVEVNEDKGHVTGTFTGKFKLPAGSKGDPVLKFEFSGELQTTRNQVFNLVTADGTKGTVELIPGTAFNLLEVNFQTEAKPGKVRQADAILVKK